MIELDSAAKSAYINQEGDMRILITIAKDTSHEMFFDSEVVLNSMELVESILDQDEFEMVGCRASKFSVTLSEVQRELKGETIEVETYIWGVAHSGVPIFKGIIEEEEVSANHSTVSITCYDAMYYMSQIDVKEQWDEQRFPTTMKQVRTWLFELLYQELGITEESVVLPNEFITIGKNYFEDVETLSALDVLKSVCQISGKFGIINRYGNVEYREFANAPSGKGANLPLFLPFNLGYSGGGGGESAHAYIANYISCKMENYKLKSIEKIIIRQNEDSPGAIVGWGNRKYIIQGNLFTAGMDIGYLRDVGDVILANIRNNTAYQPFNSQNVGLPFIEVGDKVKFKVYDFENSTEERDVYKDVTFTILTRRLTGTKLLIDEFSASGSDEIKVISDAGNKYEVKAEEVKKELEEEIKNINNGWNVKSVATLPTSPAPKTIYLVQGSAG